jgi:glycosyltransferase involved in cell wall biosynthesis
MKNRLVSIAMATYNGERFLRKQLDSIYSQSYKDIEVIICDDRSSDGTVLILEEYQKRYGLQFYINEKNIGFYRNFEKVLSFCKGSYISLADQDDIWLPDKIFRLIGAIGDYSLIFSDAKFIDENDCVFAESILKYSGTQVFLGKPFKYLAYKNCITGCTALFKRELLEVALPFPEGEMFHDWWLAFAACKMSGICFLSEPLIMYRRHQLNTLGIRKNFSLIDKLTNFLFNPPDTQLLRIQEKRLAALCKIEMFSSEEKQFLYVAKEYFHDRLNSYIHLKAFLIAIKYSQYIFPDITGIWLIKALVGTLIRPRRCIKM